MEIEEVLKNPPLPKPARTKAAKYRTQNAEKQRMLLEAAASAYVQMENGEYNYPKGVSRKFTEDGSPAPNKREVMRIAGYAPGSQDHFDRDLAEQQQFWNLVELYRIRRTDPLFGKGREGELWAEVGNESLRFLYEQVKYLPHSISIDQHVKIVKLILDAGISLSKMGKDTSNKTGELLSSLTPDKRERIMSGYEANLRKELNELEALKNAHNAADGEGVVQGLLLSEE